MNEQLVIALVEDDETVRESLKRLIQSFGYESHAFSSGEEFLASTSLFEVDCLVSDVRMRGMSGIELYHQLIASGFHFPIIFISADYSAAVEMRALSVGAYRFLRKPVEAESLMACLEPIKKSPNSACTRFR